MEAKRRFISNLIGVLIILAGLFLILVTLGMIKEAALYPLNVSHMVGNFNYTALGFLILIVGVLVIAFFSGKRKKKAGSIVSFSEMGEVRISFQAIESMILAAARKVEGIREVSTRIDSTEQGLIIYLWVKTIPDQPIPGLAGDLQKRVRDYVQEISGTNVAEVKVLVENIAHDKVQKTVR